MSGPVLPMFRQEALSHAQARPFGKVLLARPLSHAVLTLAFAGFLLLLIAFFAVFSYTRKVKVSGVLLPSGLVRVAPLQSGRVLERRAQEGQAVRTGDVLYVLASERSSVASGSAEAGIAALLQQRQESFLADQTQNRMLLAQRTDSLHRRAQELGRDRERVNDQIQLQQRRIELSQASLARQVELQQAAFVSAVQVQERQADLLDQQQRLAELQRSRSAVERDLAAAQADLRELGVQARREEEASRRNLTTVQQELVENQSRRELAVLAPQDGTATALLAEVGQSVAAGQAIATVLPRGSAMEAELYAPSRAAGFLRPGMKVTLRYQAYPYQKFGQALGVVREVSNTAIRLEDLVLPGAGLPASSTAEPVYRVRVSLANQSVTAFGTELPLKSGGLLDASVALETRRLYEWILEPLYSIKGQL